MGDQVRLEKDGPVTTVILNRFAAGKGRHGDYGEI